MTETTLVAHRYALLRRLAVACALAVLAVTSLSAYMRLSKAGLGCADWPACYGQLQAGAAQGQAAPPAEATGIAAARMAHRVVAVLVLLAALLMSMLCFDRRAPMRSDGVLALLILLLAVGLAVLGRWSSGTRVPAVAMANLLGGFAMLALCVRLSVAAKIATWPRLRGWGAVAWLLVFVQAGLGGLVSASFAGLSCVPGEACSLWAAWQESGWAGLNPWREPALPASASSQAAGVLAHSLHRHLGGLVAAVLLAVSAFAWRRGRRRTAVCLLGLVAAQLFVGGLLVHLGLPLAPALLHNMIAAMLLAVLVTLL